MNITSCAAQTAARIQIVSRTVHKRGVTPYGELHCQIEKSDRRLPRDRKSRSPNAYLVTYTRDVTQNEAAIRPR
jgi:hypothetical protein